MPVAFPYRGYRPQRWNTAGAREPALHNSHGLTCWQMILDPILHPFVEIARVQIRIRIAYAVGGLAALQGLAQVVAGTSGSVVSSKTFDG